MPITSNPTPGIPFGGRVVRWYELEMYTASSQGYVLHVDHRINAQKGLVMIRKPGVVVKGVSSYGCYSLAFDSLYDPNMVSAYNDFKFKTASVEILKAARDKTFPILDKLPESVLISDYDAYQKLFEEAVNLSLAQDPKDSIGGKRIILTLLDCLLKDSHLNKEANQVPASQMSAMTQALEWMTTRYNKVIYLEEVAQKVGYSKEAFCRLFKHIQGISPMEWLIRFRISEAKKLLMTTNLTIRTIADMTGFNSDTHLYTSFKKREGFTPGDFRKSHRLK